jgi:hypothetical protein
MTEVAKKMKKKSSNARLDLTGGADPDAIVDGIRPSSTSGSSA